MNNRSFAEKVLFVPFLNLLSLGHYVRLLRFPFDLLVAVIFILTGMAISALLQWLPSGWLTNAAALYLVFLIPALIARALCRQHS